MRSFPTSGAFGSGDGRATGQRKKLGDALDRFIDASGPLLDEIFQLYDSFMALDAAAKNEPAARDLEADLGTIRQLARKFVSRKDSASRISLHAALERVSNADPGSALDRAQQVFLFNPSPDQYESAARGLARERISRARRFTKRHQWPRAKFERELRGFYAECIRPAEIGDDPPKPREFTRRIMDALGVRREQKRR